MDAAFHQLKTAAAIAVLRTKPEGAETFCYAKQLCSKYLQAQTQWRCRYLQTQDALLHLKQQHTLSLIQHQGLAANDDDHCPPTPPSSTPETSSSGQSFLALTNQQALASSSHFIHSVVNLARAIQVESADSSDLVKSPEEERQPVIQEGKANLNLLLAETVPTCVRHLRRVVCRGQTDVSASCVLQGLDGLIMLLNSDWACCVGGSSHLHLLLKHLGDLVDDLLQRLFVWEAGNDENLMCVRTRKLLHQMLLELTTKMKGPQRYSVLQSVSANAKSLCVSLSHGRLFQTSVNPSRYECLAIALDCLQQSVMSLKVEELNWQSLRELQEDMECLINHELIQQFPLVANTVMKLTSLIELCAQSDDLHLKSKPL